MIKNILMVCTGNTCRSPMARALMADLIQKDPVLRNAGIEVDSAGTAADGDAASDGAIQVMKEHGIDISGHESKSLDKELIDWADIVLVMKSEHLGSVFGISQEVGEKAHLLSEYVGERGDVPDPLDMGKEAYRECAASLKGLLIELVNKIKADIASA